MRRALASFTSELIKLSAGAAIDADDHQGDIERAYHAAQHVAARSRLPALLGGLRGQSAPRTRDYLSSALIGATAAPTLALAASLVARAVRNETLRRHLTAAGRPLYEAAKERGPVFGHVVAGATMPRPLVGYDELAGKAVGGALTGSAVQMLRDRFSGSMRQPA